MASGGDYPLKNFEDFKRNLQTLERKLSQTVGQEFLADLDVTLSWIDYGHNDIVVDHKIYIFKEFIPAVVKALLNRNKGLGSVEYKRIFDCLNASLNVISGHFGSDDVLNKTLCAMLDQSQPLYQSIIKEEVIKAGGGKAKKPQIDFEFLNSLEIGSYLDLHKNNGIWECVMISNMFPSKSEIELTLGDDSKATISTVKEGHRLAPFGTKSFDPSNNTPEFDAVLSSASVISGDSESKLLHIPIAGDLIDVQDSNGIWCQGCVMESRTISSTSSSSGRSSEKLQFRVAYIGYGEEEDEWVDHDEDKVAQFDTMSKGRRGEFPVREEILCYSWKGFVSNQVVPAAIASDYSFTLNPIILLVNLFAKNNGFARLFAILNHCARNRTLASLEKILPLASLVASLGRIYTKEFVDNYAKQYFDDVKALLLEMTPTDIRQTSMEVIESTLTSLENFAYLYFGRNEIGGEYIEGIRLTLAVQLLCSSVLSKRLGGLKILNELIRRSSTSKTYPSGINRMVLPSTDPINNPHNVVIKYHIVPVNFKIFHDFICNFLRQADYMSILFTGNDIHDSLIDRSSLILATFAEEDAIHDSELKVLIKSGIEETPSILQVLKEIGPNLSPKKQMTVLTFVESFEGKKVTEPLVDFVNSLAFGTRKRLLSDNIAASSDNIQLMPNGSNSLGASQETVVATIGTSSGGSTTSTTPTNELTYVCEVHQKALSLLWVWSSEESGVQSATIRKSCVERLEKMLEIGVPMNVAAENLSFPWNVHWMRVNQIISDAIRGLSLLRSLVPALKVIQQFIYSWPTTTTHISATQSSNFGVTDLPFKPTRISATEFLVSKYNLYSIITVAVEALKSRFDMAYSVAFAPGSSAISHRQSVNLSKSPAVVQAAYLGEIELLLEMVYLVYRSCEKRFYPKEQISTLFRLLVSRSKVVEEFDFMMNVMAKIPTKPGNASGPSLTGDTGNEFLQNNDANTTVVMPFNFYQHSKESYLETFRLLLCDEVHLSSASSNANSYLSSRFFSIKTLKCLEKWFRWINIETTSTTTSATAVLKVDSKDGKILSVSIDPSELIGVKVFTKLIFSAYHDQVASSAVKFVSNLIKVTTPNHKAQHFRQELLTSCFQQLELYRQHSIASPSSSVSDSTPSKTMSRALTLLNGLVEESFSNLAELSSLGSSMKLFPHGSLSQGSAVTFKISSTSRNIRNQLVQNNGEIGMRMHESVEVLFNRVGALIKVVPQDLKIFRLGKELSFSLESHKSISSLPNITERECLVVVERPSSSNATPVPSAAAVPVLVTSPSATGKVGNNHQTSPNSTPIAVKVAADKTKFELFFQLIGASSDPDAIDGLWNTISMLPTCQYWLMKWVLLESDDVQQVLPFVLTKDNSSRFCELLYSLQIIETLIHPLIPVSDLMEQYNAAAIGGASLGNLIDHDWTYKFLYKHGIPFFCNSLAWITMVAKSFHENASASAGISMNLLFQAFRLIAKLMRASILRLAIAKYDDESTSFDGPDSSQLMNRNEKENKHPRMLTFLSSVREVYEVDCISSMLKKKIVSPQEAAVAAANAIASYNNLSEGNRSRASSGAVPPSPLGMNLNNPSTPSTLYASTEQFLQDEWGSNVNYSNFSREGILLLCENFATERLFWTYILSMITMSELFADQLISKDISTTTAPSVTLAAPVASQESAPASSNPMDKRLYRSTMIDLLLIWTSLGIMKPALLSKYSFSSSFGFKTKIELNYDKLLSIGTIYENNEKNNVCGEESVFNSWFPTALGNFLLWMTLFFQGDINATAANNYAVNRNIIGASSGSSAINGTIPLRSHIVHLILNQRPSSTVVTSNSPPSSVIRKDSVFVLVTLLLASAPEILNLVRIDQWKQTCTSIVEELRQLINAYQYQPCNNTNYGRGLIRDILHLEGNMKLLYVLTAKIEERFFLTIYDRRCTEFLVQEVLGLLEGSHLQCCSQLLIDYDRIRSTDGVNMTKKYVYDILKLICDRAPQLAVKIYQHVKEVHSSLPIPSVWDLIPNKESKQYQSPAKLIGGSISSGKFVGIKNLGSTCYMNALLQVLYMLSEVRDYFIYFLSLDYMEQKEELRNDLAYQLQKLFTYLTFSDKKYYVPTDWVFAFKDETNVNPMDVRLQQDAQEFFALLCDRLQTTVQMHRQTLSRLSNGSQQENAGDDKKDSSGVSAANTASSNVNINQPQDIFREVFGGKLSNPMYVSPEGNQSLQECIVKHGIREPTEEEFFCLSVNVKNIHSLEESLQQFVTGEKITDFSWEENQPKKTIVKRQCLSEISNSIIFHLKRFELNFDTFRKEKINDSFTFPLKLNMKPYMKEGLPEYQYQQQHHQQQQQQVASDNGGSPGSEGEGSNSKSTSPPPPVYDRPAAYYEYELTGVIVHTGSGESGHYYSFCKDTTVPSNEESCWYEFNDSEVSSFNINNLSQECFGGTTSVHDFNVKTQSFTTTEVMSTKNAYMLVYTRVNKLPLPMTIALASSTVTSSVVESNNDCIAFGNRPKSQLVWNTIKQIEQENIQQALSTRVLSVDYFQFYSNLLKGIINEPLANSLQKRQTAFSMAMESYRFLLKYVAKTCYHQEFISMHKVLMDFVAVYDQEQRALLWRQQQEAATSLIFPNLAMIGATAGATGTSGAGSGVGSTSGSVNGGAEGGRGSGSVNGGTFTAGNKRGQSPSTENIRSMDDQFVAPGVVNGGGGGGVHAARVATATASNSMGSSSGYVGQQQQLPQQSIGIAQPQPLAKTSSREFNYGIGQGHPPQPPSQQHHRQQSPSPVNFPPLPPVPAVAQAPASSIPLGGGRHSRANSFGSNQGQLIANMMIAVDQFDSTDSANGNTNYPNYQNGSRQQTPSAVGGGNKSVIKKSPSMNHVGNDQQVYLCKSILSEMCFHYTEMVLNNLFAPKDVLRQEMSVLYSFLLSQTWFYEQPNIKTLDVLALKVGTFSAQRHNPSGHVATNTQSLVSAGEGDDADLALALKLSQQPMHSASEVGGSVGTAGESNGITSSPSASSLPVANAMISSTIDNASIRFIIDLTLDTNMQLLVEYWRKNNAMITVLLKFAQLGYDQRWLLIQRDVIASSIDLILADQSPLNGKLYPLHSRKRVPSSAIIVPFVKDPAAVVGNVSPTSSPGGSVGVKAVSAVNLAIPNWSDLLDLIVLLVSQCVINRPENSAILPDALGYEITSPTRMSIWDMTCLTCKPLYMTLIKQSRYVPAICKLISYLALDNPLFSSMIAEVIWDEISVATVETMYNVFEVLTTFLQIKDSLRTDRFFTFFGWNPMNSMGQSLAGPTTNNAMNLHVMNSSRNMLTMMSNYRYQPIKSQVLIVFIRSFLGLIDFFIGLPSINGSSGSAMPTSPSSGSSTGSTSSSSTLSEMLLNPKPHLLSWSGWMLQFLTQQVTFMKTQPVTAATTATPFLVIYGESDMERELTWTTRTERTYQLLNALLVKWEFQPMQILQQYIQLHTAATQQPVVATAVASSPTTVASRSTNITPVTVHHTVNTATATVKASPVVVELKDGMTDEELARFLAAQDGALD